MQPLGPQTPSSYSTKSIENSRVIEVVTPQGRFFRAKNLAIYGTNPEECLRLMELFESMGQRGEFAQIVHGAIRSFLDPNQNIFALFGLPSTHLQDFDPALPRAYGMQVPSGGSYRGLPHTHTQIFIAMEHPSAQIRLTLGHESVHQYMQFMTRHPKCDPLFPLDPRITQEFWQVFEEEKLRLKQNPHPFNTPQWHTHHYLYLRIFNYYQLYHPMLHLTEIPAHTLQFELAFEGGFLRNFSPPLADMYRKIMQLNHVPLTEISAQLARREWPIPGTIEPLRSAPIVSEENPKAFIPDEDRPFRQFVNHYKEPEYEVPKLEKIQTFEGLIYKVPGLNIYAETEAGCHTLHQIYQDLQYSGTLGQVIFDRMTPLLTVDKGLELYGDSGKIFSYNSQPDAYALGLYRWGRRTGSIITVALNNPLREVKDVFAHEAIHFLIHQISPDGSADFTSSLSRKVKVRFEYLFVDEMERLKWNPYPEGSKDWHFHKEMYERIFDKFKQYGSKSRPSEYPTLALSTTISLRFEAIRKFSPPLADAFLEILHHMDPDITRLKDFGGTAIPRRLMGHDSGSYFKGTKFEIEGVARHRAPPLDNPWIVEQVPLDDLLDRKASIGSRLLTKSLKALGKGLRLLSHPVISGPLHIVFAYNKYELHAVEKALVNGIGSYTLSVAMWSSLAGTLGAVPTVVIGLGTFTASVLPDVNQLKKDLPTEGVIRTISRGNVEIETMLRADTAMIQMLGGLQDALRAFNPVELWNKFVKPVADQEIDARHKQEDLENLKRHLEELTPNLEMLQPTTNLYPIPYLDECELPWKVNETSMSVDLEIPVGLVPNIPLTSMPEPEERPTFNELARIEQIHLGEVSGGHGYGLIFTLRSGAEFSVSTDGGTFFTTVTAPMTRGFAQTLATGVLYQLPIAAALFAIDRVISNKDEKVASHLKHDARAAGKELQDVQSKMQAFKSFREQFDRGEIDPDLFINQVNDLSDTLHKAIHHLQKSGHYADKHGGNDGGISETLGGFKRKPTNSYSRKFDYFFEASKLNQLDRDLQNALGEALAKKRVQENFIPQIKDKNLNDLVNMLGSLSDKKLLTSEEGLQQTALRHEVIGRASVGSLEDLKEICRLENKPLAIHITAPEVEKPGHLHAHKDEAGRYRRQAKRTNEFMDNIHGRYLEFQNACKSGHYDEMVRTRNLVQEQLDRINNGINLKKYRVDLEKPDGSTAKYASDYLESFISQIKTGIKEPMEKANAVREGNASPYFTPNELKQWSLSCATNAFNTAQAGVNSGPDPDTAFRSLAEASKVLETLGGGNEQTKTIIRINTEYSSYSAFMKAQGNLEQLNSTVKEMNQKEIKPEKYAELLEKAHGEARLLLTCELKEGERTWVNEIVQLYQNVKKTEHYQQFIQPAFAAPASKLLVRALSESLQFPNRPLQQMLARGLSSLQLTVPQLYPSLLTYLSAKALRNNAFVTDNLAKSIFQALQDNVFSNTWQALRNPRLFRESPLSTTQAAGTALQILTGNRQISRVASALQYGETARKTWTLIKARSFYANRDKVGEGLVNMWLSLFDFYELLSKDPKEFGIGSGLIATFQSFLPNFRGNLPESRAYYMAKDAAALMLSSAFTLKNSPSMIGSTLTRGGDMLLNGWNDTYTRDALTAIMTNLRYWTQQPPSEQARLAMKASRRNLIHYLGDLKLKKGESHVHHQAKVYGFSLKIRKLAEKKSWQQIIDKTALSFETHQLIETGMAIEEQVPSLIKRYFAFLQLMDDPKYNPAECLGTLRELERVTDYIRQKRAPPEVLEFMEEMRVAYLTNYTRLYITNKVHDDPLLALEQFDAIPVHQRQVEHWYLLGMIAEKLNARQKNQRLLELQLFAFETLHRFIEDKEKEGLTGFDKELQRCSGAVLIHLRNTLSMPNTYSPDTPSFSNIIREIGVE